MNNIISRLESNVICCLSNGNYVKRIIDSRMMQKRKQNH